MHLLRDQGTVTVTEAAATLNIGLSTAHRLLSALVFRDFAIQDESRAYKPGPALGISVGPGQRVAILRRVMQRHLDAVRDLTDETVNLSVRVGASVRIVAAAESLQAVHVGNQVGTVLPAHLSSAGRAELACLDDSDVVGLVASSESFRADDSDSLRAELERTRARGYAVNRGDDDANICAVGVALRSAHGEVLGAISIAVPSYRYDVTAEKALAGTLRAVASAVQSQLDFR